jgi:plastocyanin
MKGPTRFTGMAAAIAMVAAMGCGGGGNGTPTSATNPGPGGGSGGTTNTTTITINASGVVTPNDITVPPGTRVTFVNNHNRSHEVNSDPHPSHGDCPEIDQVGFLAPGQSKLTGNLNTVRVCGFHDHNEPTNPSLTGRIRIQ